MVRLLLLVLVLVGGWQGYQHYEKKQAAALAVEVEVEELAPLTLPPRTETVSFRCDGRTYCSQMTSCAEATYFLKNCPGVKMDGNNDGIPCEQQWCR